MPSLSEQLDSRIAAREPLARRQLPRLPGGTISCAYGQTTAVLLLRLGVASSRALTVRTSASKTTRSHQAITPRLVPDREYKDISRTLVERSRAKFGKANNRTGLLPFNHSTEHVRPSG